MTKKRSSYKEPVFLFTPLEKNFLTGLTGFTSSSMRQAAWAGWHSAIGNKELAEKYVHACKSSLFYPVWATEFPRRVE